MTLPIFEGVIWAPNATKANGIDKDSRMITKELSYPWREGQ